MDATNVSIQRLSPNRDYSLWKVEVRLLLRSKDLWQLVDGTKPRPVQDTWQPNTYRQQTVVHNASTSPDPQTPNVPPSITVTTYNTTITDGPGNYDQAVGEWDRQDQEAYIFIFFLLCESYQKIVRHKKTSKELWDLIEIYFQQRWPERLQK